MQAAGQPELARVPLHEALDIYTGAFGPAHPGAAQARRMMGEPGEAPPPAGQPGPAPVTADLPGPTNEPRSAGQSETGQP